MRLILSILFLLTCFSPDRPGGDGWDDALDRYAAICERCLDLRYRSVRGEEVSAVELKQLLTRLAELRTSLQNGSGAMTPGQRARFEAIKDRYRKTIRLQDALSAGLTARRQVAEPLPGLSPVPGYPGRAEVADPSLPKSFPPFQMQFPLSCYGGPVGRGWNVFLLGGCRSGLSLEEGASAGAMVSFPFGRRKIWGGFVKARFVRPGMEGEYACNSDGTLPGGGVIWTSGGRRLSQFSGTAGLSYSLFRWADIYAGAGYGRDVLFWQDGSGRYAEVTDRSFRGLCLDAGCRFRPFRQRSRWGVPSALAGVECVGGGSLTYEIGLGWRF